MAAAQRSVIADVAVEVLRLFSYIFSHEFLFNPHSDLESDYIIRKGIRHRIQRYTMRTEILPIFHTRVNYQSVCQCIHICRHCKVLDKNFAKSQKPCRKQPLPLESHGLPSNTWMPGLAPLTTTIPNGILIQSAVLPQYTCADSSVVTIEIVNTI